LAIAVALVAAAAPVIGEDALSLRVGTQSAVPAMPLQSSTLFAKPVILRGTLGNTAIQASVRPKPEAGDGLEGEYFIFGQSKKILLAGEIEGAEVFFEESENGTDVSGQWDGKWQGETIHGTWMSADGSISKPFLLKKVQTGARPPKRIRQNEPSIESLPNTGNKLPVTKNAS
jgi:hypothetical protein